MGTSASDSVLVIGGGVIGLSIAWRAAQRGLRVTLADPAPGSGATHAAAGMLTPIAEAAYAERELFRLGRESPAPLSGVRRRADQHHRPADRISPDRHAAGRL